MYTYGLRQLTYGSTLKKYYLTKISGFECGEVPIATGGTRKFRSEHSGELTEQLCFISIRAKNYNPSSYS